MPLPPLVSPVEHLDENERARTARHAALRGFGDTAQRRLASAHVAVIGAGGLGSPVVLALSAAGVGTLTVVDDDTVELTNLQRQVLHRIGDIGRPKVDSAVRVAAELSPTTRVLPVADRLDDTNAAALLRGVDLVLDGSDTFATRSAVAAACEQLGVPLVWGVVQEFHAQITVLWSAPPAGHEPRVLADLHAPDAAGEAPSCAQVGVLGSLTLETGAVMATEAIKLLTGVGESLFGRILLIDALTARRTEIPLLPSAAQTAPAVQTVSAAQTTTAATPFRDEAAVTEPTPPIAQVTAEEMLQARTEHGATLLDVREPWETRQGIVPDSVLIPLGDFLADPDLLEVDGPVVVICAHGIRAQRAAEVLRGRGVTASVLAGGLAAWT